jgi:DNA-binding response OmpR family regulator
MFLPPAGSMSASFQPPASTSMPAPAEQEGAVLLIEDEPSIARMLLQVFAQAGLTVILARDVAEGLGLFEKHHQRIGLAFVDCRQPGVAGAEFCRRLRSVVPGFPVLFAGTRDPAVPANGDPTVFVPRPYLPTELAWQMRSLLRRTRA